MLTSIVSCVAVQVGKEWYGGDKSGKTTHCSSWFRRPRFCEQNYSKCTHL